MEDLKIMQLERMIRTEAKEAAKVAAAAALKTKPARSLKLM